MEKRAGNLIYLKSRSNIFSPVSKHFLFTLSNCFLDKKSIHAHVWQFIISFFRPVLYLPSKEISIAVKFSPIRYNLRPVPRSDGTEVEDGKPWTQYQTMFALPYRQVFAVATKNTVVFYDTQQPEPFARVSKIHYISLNDLAW